jgi:threonine dehydratase
MMQEPLVLPFCPGGVEEDTITFEPCRTLVDEWITVTEQEIAAAMLGLRDNDSTVAEGSAGVAIASYIQNRQQYAGQSVVLICCGGNISQATMDEAARLIQAGVSS